MKLSADDLRTETLRRQFPRIRGRGTTALLELVGRLGPIQSQVPRAPFLTAASRLPGITRTTVNQAFVDHHLLKTSNLRGTVHTSTRDQFPWLDAIGRRTQANMIRTTFGLDRVTPAEIAAETERFCADAWRTRKEIVAHILTWLAEQEGRKEILEIINAGPHSQIWGHSGLIRRPPDGIWEKRTDIFHRTVGSVVSDLTAVDADAAATELVRVHLRAYGPATRRDLAFFLGEGLTRIDTAVTSLGDEVVRATGPDGVDYVDLAEPPRGGQPDPGLRLLPEFDGLLLGFHGDHRDRFLHREHLPRVWAKVNGLFSPVVLHQGRIVASWKTITKGRRTDVEVQMLPGHSAPDEDLFTEPVHHLETALDLDVTDVRIRS